MYEYRAEVLSVYDGDTIRVTIDLGFGVVLSNQQVRLLGIDTPEVRGASKEAGYVSRDYVRESILGRTIILKTKKDKTGKYGRWLGDVYYSPLSKVASADDGLVHLNSELLHQGLAVPMPS